MQLLVSLFKGPRHSPKDRNRPLQATLNSPPSTLHMDSASRLPPSPRVLVSPTYHTGHLRGGTPLLAMGSRRVPASSLPTCPLALLDSNLLSSVLDLPLPPLLPNPPRSSRLGIKSPATPQAGTLPPRPKTRRPRLWNLSPLLQRPPRARRVLPLQPLNGMAASFRSSPSRHRNQSHLFPQLLLVCKATLPSQMPPLPLLLQLPRPCPNCRNPASRRRLIPRSTP